MVVTTEGMRHNVDGSLDGAQGLCKGGGLVEIGLDEAAGRLGLSRQRVHQLLHAGDLPARRVAGRWVVDDDAVDRFAESRTPGRPFSPRVAWGLIRLVESGDAPGLSAPERSRLRNRLRHRPPSLQDLVRLCRG